MTMRAAEYVRMSTDRQELSIPIQKAAIAEYAARQGFEVVRTYADDAKSGVSLAGRAGMQQLLRDVMEPHCAFTHVLVLDVSRWGRFQDVDESAYHEYHCRRHGVQVVYVAEAFGPSNSPLDSIAKHLKRVMAAEKSRELAVKVRAGQARVARMGFVTGKLPCIGYRRLAVAHDGTPKRLLADGEHKPHPSDRVRWVLGPPEEVELVQRIFRDYTQSSVSQDALVHQLNAAGFRDRHGELFTSRELKSLLASEIVCDVHVWGKTKGRTSRLPMLPPEAIRVPDVVPGIVDRETWALAVRKRANRKPGERRAAYDVTVSVMELLRSLGCGCAFAGSRCTLAIGGTLTRVAVAWPIQLRGGMWWHCQARIAAGARLLLLLMNPDGTGREFYLVPARQVPTFPRAGFLGEFHAFGQLRVTNAGLLASRLLESGATASAPSPLEDDDLRFSG